MGIAEILAARKQNKIPTPVKKEVSIFEEDILEDEIPYSPPQNAAYLPNYRIDPIFLACMAPLIRSPYKLYGIHSEYYGWLLLGDSTDVHVLNTFQPISDQILFSHFMRYNPPLQTHDLHRLYVTISRIQLNMPPIYLPRILEIIEKESIRPLDNPGFFGYTDT